jgi:hypothetical protein
MFNISSEGKWSINLNNRAQGLACVALLNTDFKATPSGP